MQQHCCNNYMVSATVYTIKVLDRLLTPFWAGRFDNPPWVLGGGTFSSPMS